MSRIASFFSHTPRWLLLAGSLALVFYIVNAVHYGREPLRIEENEWPPMGKAVFETGKPVIPADDTHRVRFNEDLTIDRSPLIGAWHPPLYIYSLGASMVVLGTDSPHALRAVGVAGLLLAAILLILIAREVTSNWRLIGGVAAIVLLLHPYAIQGSTFLDIDNSVYAPAALLVIWFAIRYARKPEQLTPVRVLAMAGAIAVVSWVKLPTTITLVAVLFIWWLLVRRPLARAAIEAIAFTALGAALFFSTYYLWCLATDIGFSYTFHVTFGEKSNRLFSDFWLVENAVHWHLRWLGAAFVLLGVAYFVGLIRHLIANRDLRPLDLPFLFGAAVLVQYVFLAPTDGTYQGKYAFPALVSMLLPITWMVLRRSSVVRRPALLLGGAAIVGVVAALLLPDTLTGLSYAGDYGSWGYELRIAAISGAALALALMLGWRWRFTGGVLVVLAILLAAQATRSYRADTSPMYPIADTGDFLAAAHDLNQTLDRGDIAVAAKDLGFYFEGRVVEGEDAFARGDGRLAAAIRRYPEIKAFARDTFGPPVGPKTEAVLTRCFRELRVFGTASVAYRTGQCR